VEEAREEDAEEADARDMRLRLVESQVAMDATMAHFVTAMRKAQELLEHGPSADADGAADGAAAGAGADAGAGGDRAEGLAHRLTHSEEESKRLAADVARRAQQAEQLERENQALREQLHHAARARGPAAPSAAPAAPGEEDWASQISDPELALKYRGGGGGGGGGGSVLDAAGSAGAAAPAAAPAAGAAVPAPPAGAAGAAGAAGGGRAAGGFPWGLADSFAAPAAAERLAWALDPAADGLPVRPPRPWPAPPRRPLPSGRAPLAAPARAQARRGRAPTRGARFGRR
jgi:hypothetical protein